MSQKELLINQIEKEREILNGLLLCGSKVEEVYHQSLVVDELIEQYMQYD
ncbi:MAG: hypothetical protein Q4C61_12220 [Lachnospiraceae bacterium]|nr:hypothetical protein [Lachnospiraceae bacterium]